MCNDHQICGNKSLYTKIAFLISFPVIFMDSITFFASASFFAMVMIISSLVAVLSWSAKQVYNEGVSELAVLSQFTWTENFLNITDYIGVSLYAMGGIGMVFPIRNAMANPDKYMSTVTTSFSFISLMCLMFQVLPYLAIGVSAKTVIFYNFGKEESLIFILEVLYAIGILLSCP